MRRSQRATESNRKRDRDRERKIKSKTKAGSIEPAESHASELKQTCTVGKHGASLTWMKWSRGRVPSISRCFGESLQRAKISWRLCSACLEGCLGQAHRPKRAYGDNDALLSHIPKEVSKLLGNLGRWTTSTKHEGCGNLHEVKRLMLYGPAYLIVERKRLFASS